MERRGMLNTFIRQKILLSLVLNNVMTPYRMAKEWTESDQQARYRKNSKLLAEYGLLKIVKRKILKRGNQEYEEMHYSLNQMAFAEQLLDRILQRCREREKFKKDVRFNKIDYNHVLDFMNSDIFKFYLKGRFIDESTNRWFINKRNPYLVTEPFIIFIRGLVVFHSRKDFERTKEKWIELFNRGYKLSVTEAELKKFALTRTGKTIYDFAKTLGKIHSLPRNKDIKVYTCTDDFKYFNKKGIEFPPRYWM